MAVANIQAAIQKAQSGDGFNIPLISGSTGNSTGAASGSGSMQLLFYFNSLGYTPYSAIPEFPYQSGLTDPMRLTDCALSSNRAANFFPCRAYKFGTLDFTTTTNEFTHDAATFPILKKILGQTGQPLSLIPVLIVTTATTTTPAVFTMDYVDQDGDATTGTVVHTMPAAATAIGTVNLLPMELSDSAVRDVTNINITTPAGAGQAEIWGVDLITLIAMQNANWPGTRNNLVRGFTIPEVNAGAATSGSASSKLTVLSTGVPNATQINGHLKGFRNN